MRILLALLLPLALPAALAAQTPAPSPMRDAAPFIALSVADLDRLVAFYADTLGFTVYKRGEVPERRIRFALLQQGNALLEILQLPDAKPKGSYVAGDASHLIHGFFKTGVVIPDIDAAYRRVGELKLPLAYRLGQPDGPYRSFGIRDPEGNLIQFFGK